MSQVSPLMNANQQAWPAQQISPTSSTSNEANPQYDPQSKHFNSNNSQFRRSGEAPPFRFNSNNSNTNDYNKRKYANSYGNANEEDSYYNNSSNSNKSGAYGQHGKFNGPKDFKNNNSNRIPTINTQRDRNDPTTTGGFPNAAANTGNANNSMPPNRAPNRYY